MMEGIIIGLLFIIAGGLIGATISGLCTEKYYTRKIRELIPLCEEIMRLPDEIKEKFQDYLVAVEKEKEVYGKECAEKAVSDYIASQKHLILEEANEDGVGFSDIEGKHISKNLFDLDHYKLES